MSEEYDAVVVGCGPAGLAVVGNLLEKHEQTKILWVDRHFGGGRICSKYREVSSNTKVALILSYTQALEPFRRVIDATPRPNAVTKLEGLDQGSGCILGHVADMFLMLTNGILALDQVKGVTGTVLGAEYNKESSTWVTQIEPANSTSSYEARSRCLILCTGSSPSALSISLPDFKYHKIDLDTALTPSILSSSLPNVAATNVGVIGSSHSAILVIMNLVKLARSSHPNLRVKWFSRRPLIYAVPMDGWILYDNTGLKGVVANFAREYLEDDKLLDSHSPISKYIEKIDCSENEQSTYETKLPECTHLIQAVGFVRDPLPSLTRDGTVLENVVYDHKKGGFRDNEGRNLTGLYGAGIAFPELVIDPAGNTELAVGFWKFMKYLKNVVPQWSTG